MEFGIVPGFEYKQGKTVKREQTPIWTDGRAERKVKADRGYQKPGKTIKKEQTPVQSQSASQASQKS